MQQLWSGVRTGQTASTVGEKLAHSRYTAWGALNQSRGWFHSQKRSGGSIDIGFVRFTIYARRLVGDHESMILVVSTIWDARRGKATEATESLFEENGLSYPEISTDF